MEKILIACFILLSCTEINAQNTTDDLLTSKKVNDFIIIKPNFNKKTLAYQVDKISGIEYNKTFSNNLRLAMGAADNNLNIMVNYYNPFKYRVVLKDTTYLDSAYASISKSFDIITGLVNTIGSQSKSLGGSASATKISNLKSPLLDLWKFNFAVGHIKNCNPNIDDPTNPFTSSLFSVDDKFYDNSENSFENTASSQIEKINSAITLIDLKSVLPVVKPVIGRLEKQNEQSKLAIDALEQNLNKLTLDNRQNSIEPCNEFLDLTKKRITILITEVRKIQEKREDIVKLFNNLLDQLQDFVDNGNDLNSVLVASYPVDDQNVRQIDISFNKRDVKLVDHEIKISEEVSIPAKRIYLREYRFVIPEFSTGIFYTNLSYQNYTTVQSHDSVFVASGSIDRYPIIEAAHLNLVFNTWQGFIHPMLQLGVGTAKDRPSLLFGGGFRFSKPKRLAITYGRVWTWKKELTNLHVGDKIAGQATLDNDLKYYLQNKTDHYIGIQYNF